MDEAIDFLQWLKHLPEGAEVKWHSWEVSPDFGWAGGWVDVRVAAFGNTHGVTIMPPDWPGEPDRLPAFGLERDLQVHAVHDPRDWFVREVPLKPGQELTTEQNQELEAALTEREGRRRGIRGGWSAGQLTRGLHRWATQQTGRSDLKWAWDPSESLPPGIQSLLGAIEDDLEPTYSIGDGVRVSDQAASMLAELGRRSVGRAQARIMSERRGAAEETDPFDI